MEYDIAINDVFEFKNNDYITLDKYKHDGFYYLFTNKLIGEEEPGKEFVIFKMLPKGLIIETDIDILNKINKVFSDNFNKKLQTIARYQG